MPSRNLSFTRARPPVLSTMIITNLLTNMVVLTFSGIIPTNTPTFQKATSDLLLAKAQNVAEKFGVPMGSVAREKITQFDAVPGAHGPTAFVLFDGRYLFRIQDGSSWFFSDEKFLLRSLFPEVTGTNDLKHVAEKTSEVFEQLRHATNRLNLKQARRLAESAMLGFEPGAKLPRGFEKPLVARQEKWRDDTIVRIEADGTVINEKKKHPAEYALPYYRFRWEGKPGGPHAFCEVEICGITASVTLFHFGPVSAKLNNYFEMLGLPPNTVLVHKRLTNPIAYEIVE